MNFQAASSSSGTTGLLEEKNDLLECSHFKNIFVLHGETGAPAASSPWPDSKVLAGTRTFAGSSGTALRKHRVQGPRTEGEQPEILCKAESAAGCPSAPQSPAPREGSCRSPSTRQGRFPRGHVSGPAGGLRSQGRAAPHPPSSCPGAGYSTFFSFQTDFESLPSGRVNVSFSHSPSAGDKRFS